MSTKHIKNIWDYNGSNLQLYTDIDIESGVIDEEGYILNLSNSFKPSLKISCNENMKQICEINGDVNASTLTTDVVGIISTIDDKLNVHSIKNSLEKIGKINGYSFNFIGDDIKSYGFNAEEIEKNIPEIVYETVDKGEIYKAIKYNALLPLLIEVIKELDCKIKSMNKTIEDLRCNLINTDNKVHQILHILNGRKKVCE